MNKNENPNTDKERTFVSIIQNDISTAESIKNNNRYCSSGRTSLETEIVDNIETVWEDEYKIKKGGGLQWSTTFAYRDSRNRQYRPNSEDNFIFNSIQTLNANMTATIPEANVQTVNTEEEANEETESLGQKLTDVLKANDDKLCFHRTFKRLVDDFNSYGPCIVEIEWDNDIIGGAGDKRFIGDVRKRRIDKFDFFPDPAITDLEEDLQDSSFNIIRYRKKTDYIKKRWKDKACSISSDESSLTYVDEGGDSKQNDLYKYRHRGFPKYVPADRAKELNERAAIEEAKGNVFKAKDLRDAAKGNLEGVHLAWYCQGVLLEYIPYEYDHGMYPIEYTTKYFDEFSQWGYGEIRNLKIPQIMHNKADEIELEAMTRQGLGGKYYNETAVTPNQMKKIQAKDGKGGEWLAVKNVEQIKDRQPVVVPASITNYKEHKQRMIQDIGAVSPIQQGISPGAGTPYRTVAELASRADVRVSEGAKKIEDLLIRCYKQEILLIEQFYTEERYYRVKGLDGKIKEGTFQADEMYMSWEREDINEDTGEEMLFEEKFVPEFDVDVKILSEKPNDRSYNTSVAFDMYDRGLMTDEDLWNTLDEGQLPPVNMIIQNYRKNDMVKKMMGDIQALPEEMQPQLMEQMAQLIEGMIQQPMAEEIPMDEEQMLLDEGMPTEEPMPMEQEEMIEPIDELLY